MIRRLRDQLRKARLKYRAAKHKRRIAKPGGARREKLRRIQDFWEARKHNRKKKLNKALERRAERNAECRPGDPNWNCCRSVTDFAIIVVDRPVTSRKRTESYGNPGSEHHVSQTSSDAVDFGVANAYDLARKLYAALTGGSPSAWGGDYSFFYFTYRGNRYRGQIIAGTHGTGPHLHFGCTRIA